jgi:MFS family permease
MAYVVLGLLVLIVGLPLASLLVKESQNGLPVRRVSTTIQSIQPSIRTRPFMLLLVAIFFYSVTFNGVISNLSAILTDRGLSLRTSAQALSVMGAAGLFGRITTGLLLDKFFAARVSLILFAATAVGVLFLSLNSAPSAFLSAAIIGFAAGGESDITPYLLSRYFSLQGFSTLYGLAWTAFAAGTAVGPILMGRLYSSTGGYQSWGIQLFALPTLLSAVLMALMPAYPKAVNLGFIDLLPAEGMGPRAVVSDL